MVARKDLLSVHEERAMRLRDGGTSLAASVHFKSRPKDATPPHENIKNDEHP